MPQVGAFIAGAFGFGSAAAWGAGAAAAFGAGATFAGTVIGGLTVKLLTSVAITALQSALMSETSQGGGITISTTLRGEDNPETVILGRYATAGQCVYVNSHGPSRRYLTHVVEVCSAPGATLNRLMLGDQWVTLAETPLAGYEQYGLPVTSEDYAGGYVFVKYYDGSQTAADASLVANYGADPDRPWAGTAIGSGLCYAILTFQFHPEKLPQVPSYRFELNGIPLYDIRKDSTRGGTGPQRLGTPSTWAQTDNAGVMIWNIMRGVPLPGGEIWGGGFDLDAIPTDVFTTAMNRCDVSVAISGGGTEPTYRAAIEAALTQEPAATVTELLKACSATIADMGHAWTIAVGAPALPVYAFTDDDVIVSKSQTLDPFPSLGDTYNAVSARFPSPEHLWESHEAPLRTDAALEASDVFGRRTANLTLPAVPYKRQVQRLGRAWLKDNRRFIRHIVNLPPDAAALDLSDTTDWTSVRNGYADKTFSLYEIAEDPRTCLRQVSIRERNPSDYDWDSAAELPMPPATVVTPKVAEGVSGFSAAAVLTVDAAGNARRVGVELSWNPDISARGIRWEYRFAGQTTVRGWGDTQRISDGKAPMAAETLPATAYQVRARLIANRKTVWTGWIDVTTASLKLGPADLDLSGIEAEIASQIDALEAWVSGGLDELGGDLTALLADQAAQAAGLAAQAASLGAETAARGELAMATARQYRDLARSAAALRDYVADLDYQSYTARETLRRQIGVVVEGYAASFDERITTAASATGAVAERVTVLEADSDVLDARITTVDTARVDGQNALAQQIAAVSVGTNTQFDPSKIWYFDAAPDGWTGSPSAPSATGGYLRPASGAGPSVVSPGALAVEGAVYSQVRARLRRIGTPAWTGYLWWQATGAGWDAARRATIPEPTWSDGLANITVTPGWTGLVDQIRLDLATTGDGANYIEIDWVGIGRPSPGASRAELIAEQTARIAADMAQSSAIVALDASLADLAGDAAATAGAVDALDIRVTSNEGLLSSQGTAITGLQSDVAGKASTSAVTALTTEVTALADGLTSQSASVSTLRNTINPLAAETIDAQFAAYLSARGALEAAAAADEVLRSDVSLQGSTLTAVSERVTSLEATVPGLASAASLQSLTNRVTVTETAVTSQSQAITDLQAQVADKASTSALAALTAEVSEIDGAVVALASNLTSLEATVDDKAAASALSSLTARVADAEGELVSQSSALTNLETALAGKAAASAVTELTTRVTTVETTAGEKNRVYRQTASPTGLTIANAGDLWFDTDAKNKCFRWSGSAWVAVQDGNIPELIEATEAQAEALTALDVATGKYSAGGRFRVSVEATPSGATSRVGLSATASDGDTTQTAALFLEATSSGENRALVNASRFAIVNGADRVAPFIVEGGEVYIRSAFIKDASITGAKIGDLEVDTIKIKNGAITNGASGSRLKASGSGTTPFTRSFPIICTAGANVAVWFKASLFAELELGSTPGTIQLAWNGVDINTPGDVEAWSVKVPGPDGLFTTSARRVVDHMVTLTAIAGTNTLTVTVTPAAYATDWIRVTGPVLMIEMKR